MIYWHEIKSPVGKLLLAGDGEALIRVHFQAGPHPFLPRRGWRHDAAPFAAAITQLAEYFCGTRRAFELPLAPTGTPFQLAVWEALRAIPYGETISYGELDRRAEQERQARIAEGVAPRGRRVHPVHRLDDAPAAHGYPDRVHRRRRLLTCLSYQRSRRGADSSTHS